MKLKPATLVLGIVLALLTVAPVSALKFVGTGPECTGDPCAVVKCTFDAEASAHAAGSHSSGATARVGKNEMSMSQQGSSHAEVTGNGSSTADARGATGIWWWQDVGASCSEGSASTGAAVDDASRGKALAIGCVADANTRNAEFSGLFYRDEDDEVYLVDNDGRGIAILGGGVLTSADVFGVISVDRTSLDPTPVGVVVNFVNPILGGKSCSARFVDMKSPFGQ